MGVQACPTPWSHYGTLANALPSYIWPYRMHRTHQPCNQIWAHPLPNGHLLRQSMKGQPHLKSKNKNQKPNVKMNILGEGIAKKDKRTKTQYEGIAKLQC